MKSLILLAAGFGVGYLAMTKAMPFLQAKFEGYDLDNVWELWDNEDWIRGAG